MKAADRAAAISTLIHTARINDVDPHAWLADVLARLQDHPGAEEERSLQRQLAGELVWQVLGQPSRRGADFKS
jgi:transposase